MNEGPSGAARSIDTSAYNLLQQQLITTRARLDRQVSQLTRLNQLSDRLLRRPDERPVAEVFAEAVVDVLDLALGAVWLLPDPAGGPGSTGGPHGQFAVFGAPVALDRWAPMGATLAERLAAIPTRGAVPLSPGDVALLPGPGLVDPIACRAVTRDGRCAAVVLAANTRQVAGMDVPEGDESRAFLVLLAEKLAAQIDSVADRHQIEDQLARLTESERQLGLVLRGSNDGWWDWDLRSNECLLSVRWQEMTGGLTDYPLRTGFWTERIHPEDRPAFDEALAAALAGLVPGVEMEIRVLHAEGGEFPALVRGTVSMDAAGRPAHFAGSILDLTERKRQQAELLRVEARLLESAKMEALGVLAGGIAHDFNNLLAVIMGNIDLARSDLDEGSFVDRTLASAEVATSRAADLARQMLAYSGRGTFTVGPVGVGDLLREMGDLLRSSVAKSATLVHEHTPGLPRVRADETQLRQVALNLIVNASDALGGQPGTITLRTAMTHLDADDPALVPGTDPASGTYVMLEVTDTGWGMERTTLARIFDPFYSTKSAGRGLGLASALGIVKGHKGAIRVWSEPGRGTRFQVLLPPLAEDVVAEVVATGAVAAATVTGHVLVVDDDRSVRIVARQILERAGFLVSEAPDGPDAVAMVQAGPRAYDLVLLDITLATTDGIAVLGQLRAIRVDLPVILCSGWTNQEVASRLTELPRVSFLQKPFRAQGVVDAVREHLRVDGTA